MKSRPPALECHDRVVRCGSFTAVDHVSLVVQKGEGSCQVAIGAPIVVGGLLLVQRNLNRRAPREPTGAAAG
jgi:hypothetical protein